MKVFKNDIDKGCKNNSWKLGPVRAYGNFYCLYNPTRENILYLLKGVNIGINEMLSLIEEDGLKNKYALNMYNFNLFHVLDEYRIDLVKLMDHLMNLNWEKEKSDKGWS